MSPGEEDAHESRVGPDAHGSQREEDDAGGLVLGVALERRLCGNPNMKANLAENQIVAGFDSKFKTRVSQNQSGK